MLLDVFSEPWIVFVVYCEWCVDSDCFSLQRALVKDDITPEAFALSTCWWVQKFRTFTPPTGPNPPTWFQQLSFDWLEAAKIVPTMWRHVDQPIDPVRHPWLCSEAVIPRFVRNVRGDECVVDFPASVKQLDFCSEYAHIQKVDIDCRDTHTAWLSSIRKMCITWSNTPALRKLHIFNGIDQTYWPTTLEQLDVCWATFCTPPTHELPKLKLLSVLCSPHWLSFVGKQAHTLEQLVLEDHLWMKVDWATPFSRLRSLRLSLDSDVPLGETDVWRCVLELMPNLHSLFICTNQSRWMWPRTWPSRVRLVTWHQLRTIPFEEPVVFPPNALFADEDHIFYNGVATSVV